ncbi:MAG TPA: VOC family protein [Acidimicrobiales bacterium]|nr:VOC family protein [Acidimicrobiales bacterium]
MEILSGRTMIHPRDLERTLTFYQDGFGLAVAREFGAGATRGVVFFLGGGLLEVVGHHGSTVSDASSTEADQVVALWWQVRDIGAAVEELEQRGVAIARPPVLEPWGLIEAWVDDPDGIRIHLVEVPEGHPLRRDLRPLNPS